MLLGGVRNISRVVSFSTPLGYPFTFIVGNLWLHARRLDGVQIALLVFEPLAMKPFSVLCLLVAVVSVAPSCRRSASLDDDTPTPSTLRGAVRGHVRLSGVPPENEKLRMAADPMCKAANGSQPVLDDAIVVGSEGALANVFVELLGEFPDAPAPTGSVSVDQIGCVYRPRVIGMRVGQSLHVHNSDNGLHNVHGVSTDRDTFNVSQPVSGMTNVFHPHDAGILRLKCDVHTWMVAFVGVVNHPYFAVTSADGAFALRDIPVGTYTLRAWHERFGTTVSQVRIDAREEAALEMTYTSSPSNP